MSVAIVRKLARFTGIPFSIAADEFRDLAKNSPTLLIIQLHRQSRLFPDIYYNWYGQHFTLIHDLENITMSGTLKSMWERCSTTHMRPGTKLPPGQSYLRPSQTVPCMDSQWTPACGSTKTGQQTSMKNPHQPNISSGSLGSSCHSVWILENHISHLSSLWVLQRLVPGRPETGSHLGYLTLLNTQSQLAWAQSLQAQVPGMIPGRKRRKERNTIVIGNQN